MAKNPRPNTASSANIKPPPPKPGAMLNIGGSQTSGAGNTIAQPKNPIAQAMLGQRFASRFKGRP